MENILFLSLMLGFVLVRSTNSITRPTNIVLENNGYKNILVAIHPNVAEDPNLINNIKQMFIDASAYMYIATYYRAYFQQVTILIPATWKDDSSYQKATTQLYDNADIEFASPNPLHSAAPRPFSRSYSGCGSPGIRIHLAPDFLTDRNILKTLGPIDRVLVHEWGRFRWGVFEEYTEHGEQQFYFSPTTGKYEAVRCSMAMSGRIYRFVNGSINYCRELDPITGRYPDDCLFSPYDRGPRAEDVEASIMHKTMVKGIKYFCDDNPLTPKKMHNFEAPNKQNRLCGQRSTWSVIMDSPDFKSNNNPPRAGIDTTTTFTVVKAAKTRRLAIVLDTSGSMMDDDAVDRLRQVTADYIHTGIDTNSQVGLVAFNDKAKISHPMTTIKTHSDKVKLKDSLPTATRGATSIGSGIHKAIQLLSSNGGNSSGSEILVLTDGVETTNPRIDGVLSNLRESGAIMTVLALNQLSDENLTHAAHSTGGYVYFDNNQDQSTTLIDALFKLRQYPTWTKENRALQIMSRAGNILPGDKMTGHVSIDDDVGRHTVFTVMYSKIEPTIIITSPSGRIYNKRYPEYKADDKYNTARIEIPEIAESGLWVYNIINNKHQGTMQKISIMVTSEPVDDSREPVKINGILSSASVMGPGALMIHAEVTKGSLPVTGMTVTATVDRPFADPVSIQLLDNGAGADINKNDGVYSRYFSQYSNTGIYSVKIEVSATVGQGMVRKTLPHQKQTESLITDTDSSLTVRTRRQTSEEPLMVYISRSTTAGSFLYKNMAPSAALPYPSENIISDVLPPARITDLTVLKTSHKDQTVMLSWTAPGDDFDVDAASSYDIMMSHDVEDMVNHQNTWKYISQNDILHGNLETPKVAGMSEIFILKVPFIPGEKVALVFSVRGVDKQGNMADKSNFVTTAFGYLPDYVSKEYQPIIESVTESPDLPSPKEINAFVGIVGSLAAALFLTIIISLLLHKFGSSKSSDITKRDKSCVV